MQWGLFILRRANVTILLKRPAKARIKAPLSLGRLDLVMLEEEVLLGSKDPLCGSQLENFVKVAGNLIGNSVKPMCIITAVRDPGVGIIPTGNI